MISYCFECGAKLEYQASAKPKFCHSCGTPLAGSERQSEGKVAPRGKNGPRGTRGDPRNVRAEDQEIDDFGDDENLRVPENLDGLDYEVSFADNQTFKLGDILEQSVREAEIANEMPTPLNLPAQKGKRASQKKVVAQFKKEAGTLRQKRPKKK